MRILVFSDLHLHNWNYGATLVDGMNSRLLDQAKVLQQIADYCDFDSTEIDYIVFAGDLFHCHGKIDASVLKVAYEGLSSIFEKSLCYATFIVGNHDTSMRSKQVHALHWLKAFPFVRVVNESFHGNTLSYLAYTESQQEIENFFKEARPICFMHQGLANVPMKSGFVINEVFNLEMIPNHVEHVYTGHYHPHKRVSDKATVIGTPLQLTWADEGDTRGFLILNTDTGSCEQIESVAPKFRTVDLGGITSLGDTDTALFTNNFVRLTNYDGKSVDDIRKEIMAVGARSVEFIPQGGEPKRLEPLSENGFHLPTLVREYEKLQEVSPARSQIGKEIMK